MSWIYSVLLLSSIFCILLHNAIPHNHLSHSHVHAHQQEDNNEDNVSNIFNRLVDNHSHESAEWSIDSFIQNTPISLEKLDHSIFTVTNINAIICLYPLVKSNDILSVKFQFAKIPILLNSFRGPPDIIT